VLNDVRCRMSWMHVLRIDGSDAVGMAEQPRRRQCGCACWHVRMVAR
jgi:hypothetical protein